MFLSSNAYEVLGRDRMYKQEMEITVTVDKILFRQQLKDLYVICSSSSRVILINVG